MASASRLLSASVTAFIILLGVSITDAKQPKAIISPELLKTECDSRCDCTLEREGEVYVSCTSKELTQLPDKIPPQTHLLDMSHNNFESLSEELFLGHNYSHLRKIKFTHSNIEIIANDTFNDDLFPTLEYIDLSNNNLRSTEELISCLENLISLRIIDISYNEKVECMKVKHALPGLKVVTAENFPNNASAPILNIVKTERLPKEIINSENVTSECDSRYCDCTLEREDEVFVSCTHKQLSQLPNRIPPQTHHLDMSYNYFETLSHETFRGHDFSHLRVLKFTHCNIEIIVADTFNDDSFPYLKSIDLSNNNFRTTHGLTSSLVNLKSLRIVDISYNENLDCVKVKNALLGVRVITAEKVQNNKTAHIFNSPKIASEHSSSTTAASPTISSKKDPSSSTFSSDNDLISESTESEPHSSTSVVPSRNDWNNPTESTKSASDANYYRNSLCNEFYTFLVLLFPLYIA